MNNKGENNPMFGKSHSEETKRKIAKSRKKYKMENHPNWNGGKRVNHRGYIEVKKPDHHRARGNGYVFEHILVMEEKLNRPISIEEEVHHIDGDKANNDPENLMVLSKSDHAKETGRMRREKNLYPCEVCEKKVYRKPYHKNKINHVFCSRHCQGVWTLQNKKGVFKNAK